MVDYGLRLVTGYVLTRKKLSHELKLLSFLLFRLPLTSRGRTDQHITDLETKCYRRRNGKE